MAATERSVVAEGSVFDYRFARAHGLEEIVQVIDEVAVLHSRAILVAEIFWGLWLFPFGILVIRSRFIPHVLGYLLFLAALGYLASSLTFLLLPAYGPVVDKFASQLPLCELPIIFWLLIWGAKMQPTSPEPVSSAA